MENLLKTVSDEPSDFTYLGIGSCPHLAEGQTLEAKYDQLIPLCFHERIVRDKKQTRIIHFDSAFAECHAFLTNYMQGWNLVPMDFEGGWSWISEVLEVIVIPSNIEHEEHSWFFESLCDTILNTKGKLVIQEFTGYELTKLNQKLYIESNQKEKFKRRILLDMTFGTDSGCCTDMTKAQPFYDYNGDFLNFHFATDADAKRWIGISLKVDELLRRKYRAKYLQTLNHIHVDYRRKCKGDTLMYGHTDYTNESSPEEIMKVLEAGLKPCFEILLALRVIEQAKQSDFTTLFQTYKEHDPYKWYDAVSKLLPL
jgi:hypothetical protein